MIKSTKICSQCKEIKDKTQFFFVYKVKNKFLRGECKECTRKYKRIWRIKNREKCRIYGVKSYYLHRRKRIKAVVKYNIENKLKYNARRKLEYAVRCGVLSRPKICPKCLTHNNVEAHHEDYSKPLEVKWLCRICHTKLHQYKI